MSLRAPRSSAAPKDSGGQAYEPLLAPTSGKKQKFSKEMWDLRTCGRVAALVGGLALGVVTGSIMHYAFGYALLSNATILSATIPVGLGLMFAIGRGMVHDAKNKSYIDWFDTIDDDIILGREPQTEGHIKKLYDKGVRAIVSIIKKERMEKNKAFTDIKQDPMNHAQQDHISRHIIQMEDGHQIPQMHLSMRDHTTPSIAEIDEVVDFMDAQIRAGNKVYIHCKAGKGRSSTILVCYLMKHKGYRKEDAVALINKKRITNTLFRQNKQDIILAYEESLRDFL